MVPSTNKWSCNVGTLSCNVGVRNTASGPKVVWLCSVLFLILAFACYTGLPCIGKPDSTWPWQRKCVQKPIVSQGCLVLQWWSHDWVLDFLPKMFRSWKTPKWCSIRCLILGTWKCRETSRPDTKSEPFLDEMGFVRHLAELTKNPWTPKAPSITFLIVGFLMVDNRLL